MKGKELFIAIKVATQDPSTGLKNLVKRGGVPYIGHYVDKFVNARFNALC